MKNQLAVLRGFATRRRWWLTGAAATVVVATVVWLAWPMPPEPRARQYLDYKACLLTDARGIQGAEAAAVWAGLQDGSTKTRAKVQRLAVAGPATTANAAAFANSLAQSQCDLIFAAGELPIAAVDEEAKRWPAVRFFTVGGGTPSANVTRVDGDPTASVSKVIVQAVGDRSS